MAKAVRKKRALREAPEPAEREFAPQQERGGHDRDGHDRGRGERARREHGGFNRGKHSGPVPGRPLHDRSKHAHKAAAAGLEQCAGRIESTIENGPPAG